MKVLSGGSGDWPVAKGPSALAVGVFDGIHAGHRSVLGELRAAASAAGLPAGVVTFDPHPLTVVAPERAPLMLTSVDQRVELLDKEGIGLVAVFRFDEDSRLLAPAGFVSGVLVEGLGARIVVVGEDFRFGRDRTGHVGLLRELGNELGFEAVVVPLVGGDRPVSSTGIRRLVAAGDVAAAADALGRWHEVRGRVVPGDGRGRSIGVPTANLEVPPPTAVPGRGVYAVFTVVPGGDIVGGVANVGSRPTFPGSGEAVEVHLLDGDEDLYGEELRVRFVARMRDERRFPGPDELIVQIRSDIVEARRFLAAQTP